MGAVLPPPVAVVQDVVGAPRLERGQLTFFLPDDDDDLPAPLIRAFSLPVPLPPLLPAASPQSFSPLWSSCCTAAAAACWCSPGMGGEPIFRPACWSSDELGAEDKVERDERERNEG